MALVPYFANWHDAARVHASPAAGGAARRARRAHHGRGARGRRRGGADALTGYPRELAEVEQRKDYWLRTPGHPPPHDIVDPL
jgi:hypothetical protein